jgi:hypothetical protein
VRLKGTRIDWDAVEDEFTIHHFGFVRDAARLRQKWRLLGDLYSNRRRRLRLPGFLFNWIPHDWRDPQFLGDLATYGGPYVKAVRDNPDEFVRDGFSLYHYLRQKDGMPGP